jgi:hypothetical protein
MSPAVIGGCIARCAITLSVVAVAEIWGGAAFGDTPASQVSTQTVGAAQAFQIVPKNGEAWFDTGGFCKIVDVGDVTVLGPDNNGKAVDGTFVAVPETPEQWVRIPIVPATYSDHYPATVTDCKSGLLTAVSRQV